MIKFRLRHLKLFSFALLIYSVSVHSSLSNFETTRMKSTAGAGAGSILMDEATFLNPAPMAFFNVGSIYLSRGTGEQATTSGKPLGEAKNFSAIVSDSKGSTAGSFSYNTQTIGATKTKRLAAALAKPIKKKSAMGFSVRKTSEETPGLEEKDFIQTVVGITHAISNDFTLGFIAFDPLKKRIDDSMGIVGIQYVFEDFISIMLDAGANYYQKPSETFLYKGAAQFKLLDSFYARFGYSRDLGVKINGTGVGLGWVQPRLVIEAALKNLETFSGQESDETSISLSYRF